MWKFNSTIPKEAIPYSLPDEWDWFYWEDLILNYEQGLIRSLSQLGSGNVSYLKMGDLDNNGGCSLSNLAKTQASEEEIDVYSLKKGDFLINVRNSMDLVGKTCVVGETEEQITLFNHMLVRIRHHEEIPSSFINAFFNIPSSRKLLDRCKQGTTTVIALYKRDLLKIPIPLPGKKTLNHIAAFYEAIDAKIALNHRINGELEGMAKLLYDYWFVQYDFPLSAAQAAALGKPRLAGQPYRSSGGPMIFDPQLKREIPEGWEVGNLLDIATFTNGIACQKFPPTSDEHLRVIKIKEMHSGFTETSEKVTTEVPEKVIVRDGDILFSWSASLEVMIWTGGKGALNQHIFKVTSDNYPRSICYFTLQGYLQHFKMMADQRKTTMGHITREHLEQSRIAIPPKEIGNEFESVTQPIFEQIINNHQQNQELTTLRDWLLPMLMNGQVKVR
jgi:type I restriction enzyme S subunit